ncbi:hypothetical protein HSHS1_08110 [Helicobacter suis HS1]|nr:hypothetical protein HSHS1_08110 [Helicobacter suis HS1]
MRQEIGAVASFEIATIVSALPKTRSGKILRKNLRELADGLPLNIPVTIEDASVLRLCEKAINALGYPKGKKAK